MQIVLTPELEQLVRAKVASGLYSDAGEVVRDALRLMAEQDRRRDAHVVGLRAALVEGLAQAERGELHDGPTVIAELRRGLRGTLGSGA